ncbi:MAG: TIGR01906 family membrane protein [Clostridium sp.]
MKYVYLTLISISTFLIILLSSLLISTYDKNFYIKQFHKNNTYNNQMVLNRNLNPEVIANEVIEYLKDNSDNLNRNGYFESREIIHMKDVKDLFSLGKNSIIIASIILAISCILLYRNHIKGWRFYKFLLIGYLGFTAFIGTVLTIGFMNFSKSFVIFHEAFFSNDLWLLNPDTSIIINIMPESFFLAHSLNIFIIFLILSLLLTIGLIGMLYLNKRKSKEDIYANI